MRRGLFLLLAAPGLGACGAASQTTMSSSKLAPVDVRSCVLKTLGRLKYTVVAASADSTTVRAEKKLTTNVLSLALSQATYWNVIEAVISPSGSGKSALEVTLHVAQQPLGRPRVEKGIALTSQLKKDGEALQSDCR